MPDWQLAQGYRFAGLHCGIRPEPDRRDLALLVSDRSATAAGVFTQNRIVAAPVQICRQRLPASDVRGIVICSGNANACTGQRGLDDARRMTDVAAQSLDCEAKQVLVCSTGVIGRPLPMPCIEEGIRQAAKELQSSSIAFEHAAHAILTTDTHIKVSTRQIQTNLGTARVTGLAKGAAMIGPNMATLLAFVLTDAPVAVEGLVNLAASAANQTFNCVRVEGHTSTNDSLIFLANGAGPPWQGEALAAFESAATGVCRDLAMSVAGDAEGATHLVTIQVEGTRDDEEARQIGCAVADSPLVKTAIYGADPNWGRIVSAAGYAGVDFQEVQLSLWLGDIPVYQAGAPLPFDAATASAYIKNNRAITFLLRFTLGSGQATVWTCDLTPEYVHLNADYTT
ncbi:MAG: bifunctional glutamate N-acetyltransferase/amino-acid acetyltransferase ArgJ [Gemmataceae bacterium]